MEPIGSLDYIFTLILISNIFVEAEGAIRVLNGRWFGGRVLKVELYDQAKFNAKDLTH